MSKKVNKKIGNKYKNFSNQGKSEGSALGSGAYGACPSCETGKGKIGKTGKIALCLDCHKGTNGHSKLSKPKQIDK